MRYFLSSGEASGEASAVALAERIRIYDPDAHFEGIGASAMRSAGIAMWRDHTGWASMGPAAAIPRIPKLLAAMLRTATHVNEAKPDLVILVDFGVFNLRLARQLRRMRYRGPILDVFPPGTWLDDAIKARRVAQATIPVTAFAHQRDFYRSLGCRIEFFGHPLTGRYAKRPQRPPPPPDGGVVAMLPGSRGGELRRHVPLLLDALEALRRLRPAVRGRFAAADARAERHIGLAIAERAATGVSIERGVLSVLEEADGAWVASGTAVLETALLGVPAVAIYVIPPALVWYGQRMIKHRFITLPNLVLGREVVPELLQDAATPQALAERLDGLMRNPDDQLRAFDEMRTVLGPEDALDRCAEFAVSLARGST
jgi:lipid-A-disaccharide synthase